jgi:hypothetical protein
MGTVFSFLPFPPEHSDFESIGHNETESADSKRKNVE